MARALHKRAYNDHMPSQFSSATWTSEQLHQVAREHYVEGMTMERIAKTLDVSRSTVSRMLKRARDSGIVRISVADPLTTDSRLNDELSRRFGVTAQVVSVRNGVGEVNRLDHVTAAASNVVGDVITDGVRVGCAWGTTLASLARQLRPKEVEGVKVIQINGGANARTSGIPYVGQMISQFAGAFSAESVLFPVPAFFDAADTRAAMWRERSIAPLLAEQRAVDIAIFGVGALNGPVASHVYVGGYLDSDDLESLEREKVVGDVCTVFLRQDGSWDDIEINARATGLNPDELRRIEKRICIAAGVAKTTAVLGAMRAQVATDLVVDDSLARSMLEADSATNGAGARR